MERGREREGQRGGREGGRGKNCAHGYSYAAKDQMFITIVSIAVRKVMILMALRAMSVAGGLQQQLCPLQPQPKSSQLPEAKIFACRIVPVAESVVRIVNGSPARCEKGKWNGKWGKKD